MARALVSTRALRNACCTAGGVRRSIAYVVQPAADAARCRARLRNLSDRSRRRGGLDRDPRRRPADGHRRPWFFRYNDFGLTLEGLQCRFNVPVVGLELCWDHEGDWEGVTVVAPARDLDDVQYVSYSSHGTWWKYGMQVLRFRGGTRPVVNVARGSHANYPVPCYSNCLRTTAGGQSACGPAGSSPGLVQRLGAALDAGDAVTVTGTAAESAELTVRVTGREGLDELYSFRGIGLTAGGSATATVEAGTPPRLVRPDGGVVVGRLVRLAAADDRVVDAAPVPVQGLSLRRSGARLRLSFAPTASRAELRYRRTRDGAEFGRRLLRGRAARTRVARLTPPRPARYVVVRTLSASGELRSEPVVRRIPRIR